MSIWNKIKIQLDKYSLIWKLLLISLTISGLTSFSFSEHSNIIESEYYEGFVWLTNWQSSGNYNPQLGLGKFYYRIGRSSYPVDKSGNYRYEIHFISESYLPGNVYDINGNQNGILEQSEVYISSTKIDEMKLFVNNQPYINRLTNSHTFWLLFNGNYNAGIGDVGVVFNAPLNSSVYIKWTYAPKPY